VISEAVRKRLQRLNRPALPARCISAAPRKEHSACVGALPPTKGSLTSLEEVVDGREVATSAGKFLLIDRSASHFLRHGDEFIGDYSHHFEEAASAISEDSAPIDFVRFVKCGLTKSVFLDIETTGLGGSPLFLVGLLFHRGDELRLRQLFARDYSEEKPLLQYLTELLGQFDALVTFNGKSFDMPYIRNRCRYSILPFRVEIHHLDILHEYRRRWKRILPNCRLQTLESRICYRYRAGDIPGSEIPKAYHDFVRTGDARQIKSILHHNALDLLTTSELTLRLFTPGPDATTA